MNPHEFATYWVAAWNAHDQAAILSHYAEDIEFHSPFVRVLNGDPTGALRGKPALAAYIARGLAAYPDLRFELLHVCEGAGSLTLIYRSVGNRLAAEMFLFDAMGRVRQAHCHYNPAPHASSP
jgi:hypothetical protein